MNIRPLSKSLQEEVENKLNEDPNQLEKHVTILKEWLLQQKHLKYKNDDQLLVNFLRASKHSIQRAKEKLDAYYTFRTIAPELATQFDPLLPEIQAILKLGVAIPLPIPEENPASVRFIINRFREYDAEKITATHFVKAVMLTVEILLNECDNFVVSGVIAIWDLKGVQMKTTLQITPALIKKTVYGIEKAYPTRVKATYLINVSTFHEVVINLCKMIVSKKLAERVHVCDADNIKELYKVVPKAVLPTEYGGEAGPMEDLIDKWKTSVESRREKLMNEMNYYSDESKRTGVPNAFENMFGVEGTFRTLEID